MACEAGAFFIGLTGFFTATESVEDNISNVIQKITVLWIRDIVGSSRFSIKMYFYKIAVV
jgi:hypothetical protein